MGGRTQQPERPCEKTQLVLCDVRNQDSIYSREEEGGSDWEQGLPGCWRLSILIQVAITKVCSFSDHLLSYDWHTFLYVSSPSITKLKTFKTSVHLAWPTNKKHGYQKKKSFLFIFHTNSE